VIQDLDGVLRHVLLRTFSDVPVSQGWVRFQPPDDTWRQYVSGLDHPALNVYLVDMREDRRLRTNELVRRYTNGGATDRPAPRRMTCHYLISAWHHAPASAQFDPTPEEHRLLYKATALLMDADPLVPADVFAPDPAPFPTEFAKVELPTAIMPVDGFPKYAEFWGTMGQVHPWKPSVYLTVTIPVEVLTERPSGPMVTTRITEYRQRDKPASAEVWIQIGGLVRTEAGETFADAWVAVESAGGPIAQSRTDAQGRFTFTRLRPGSYTLRARVDGHAESTGEFDVPSIGGEYDLIVS
jgi:Pvc16 N-terminal domain/Carboxypeptidase regulatory-like domain